MLFNSVDFAIFLPLVFFLYWFAFGRNLRIQNLFVVAASYFFYGWWDYRFLSLIFISTMVDYTVGLGLKNEGRQIIRKALLGTSIAVNLGLLAFFKYYNFFLDNFLHAFSFFGTEIHANSLNVILPVGISFYTFQTLSYTIDIYRRRLKPVNDLVAFTAFVSFFPQLVAGPIERASSLLPQFQVRRLFNYPAAVLGLRQILWGLFKKVVIADNCAEHANNIFANSSNYSSSCLFLGAVFFSFQIYCDFSGYSDIAIGASRLFGFKLMRNFAYPYFSRDIAEFWRRWHISLSTWFRDYLYIPLGGSKGSTWVKVRNIFIIFVVSGFWHGAKWTFIFWGVLNAVYFLPLMLAGKNRTHMSVVARGRILPTFKEARGILVTFLITIIAWIFFRAENLPHAFAYLSGLVAEPASYLSPSIYLKYIKVIILISAMLVMEWTGREHEFALEKTGEKWFPPFRYTLYYALVISIFWFGGREQDFIYFQF